MLFIRPNSRQIPSHSDYTSHPLYHDLIYGYLQSISLLDKDGNRYVKAGDASRAKISSALGISSPTVKKYFEGMQCMYLIGPKENGKYLLNFIAEEYGYLVPLNILERIIGLKKIRLLSMYIWFSMMSYDNSTVYYSMNGVKKFVGLSTNTADNGHLVKEGLDDLQSLGLLRHSEVTVMEDGRYKTKKMVRDVKNE